MPRLASDRLVSQLQRVVGSSAFGDTANYIARTQSGVDTYGEPTYSTVTTAISCSFTDKVSAESWQEFGEIGVVDAEIRFAAVTPTKGSAITITARFDDTAFVDKQFEIVGIKDRGAFGYVCALKAIDV